jgi:hypothetical protein
MVVVPHLNIYPNRLVTWYSYEDCQRQKRDWSGFRENKPRACLTQKANKNLSNAINWLIYLSKQQEVNDGRLAKKFKFKINFLTLTLPAPQIEYYELPCGKKIYSDSFFKFAPAANLKFGKFHYFLQKMKTDCYEEATDLYLKSRLLNQFLTELREKWKVTNYVWKAETQANGSLHFHITMNKYIYHGDLRTMWNRILEKTDFIKRYHDKFAGMSLDDYYKERNKYSAVSWKKCIKAYETGSLSNWSNPNTIDIHAIRHIGNLPAYIAKYFCKTVENRRYVEGFLWRLSESISAFKSASTVMGSTIISEFDYLKKVFKDKFKEIFRIDKNTSQPIYVGDILFINLIQVFRTFENSMIVETFRKYVHNILNPVQPELQPVASISPKAIIKPSYTQVNIF